MNSHERPLFEGRDPPAPLDAPLWTVSKNGQRITAFTRVSSDVDGVELRYTLEDGRFACSALI